MERQDKERGTEILNEKEKRPTRHMEAGRGQNGEPSVDALRRWFIWAGIALLLCLVFVLGGAALTSGKNKVEEAVLELDGGPVVELRLNRKGAVLAASGLNDAGTEILKGAELEKATLEQGMEFLISAYAESGSLKETGAVFLTVRKLAENSYDNTAKLADQAVLYAKSSLIKRQIGVTLYSGVLEMDTEVEELVEKYQISPGKAGFIKNLVDKNVRLKLEDQGRLAGMDTSEIAEEMRGNNYNTSFASVLIKTSYAEQEPTAAETEKAEEEETETVPETGEEPAESESDGESRASTEQTTASETSRARSTEPATTAPATTAPATTAPATTAPATTAPDAASTESMTAGPSAIEPTAIEPTATEPMAVDPGTAETTAAPGIAASETVLPPVEIPQTEPQTEAEPETPEETQSPPVSPEGPGFAPGAPGSKPEQTP